MTWSQTNEESIIGGILSDLRIKEHHYLVDIGAGFFGRADFNNFSNTKFLIEQGWKSCRIDKNCGSHKEENVHEHFVDQDNVVSLLDRYRVPEEFGLLSIDIDGVDLYVLRRILACYRPILIAFEFNGCRSGWDVITYDPQFQWKEDDYYGASWNAFKDSLKQQEYTCVAHQHSLNGYAVRNDFGFTEVQTSPSVIQYHPPSKRDDVKWLDARYQFGFGI